jgi:hypothetical protein
LGERGDQKIYPSFPFRLGKRRASALSERRTFYENLKSRGLFSELGTCELAEMSQDFGP